jgi:3-methyladenine DNA glycosylase AlkC
MSDKSPVSSDSAVDAEPRFSLKDHLFNRQTVTHLSGLLASQSPGFAATAFVRRVLKDLPSLELKQRITHIAATLEQFLPTDFRVATRQITAALPPPLDPTRSDDDFGDFIFAPLGEWVVRNGLQKSRLKRSLQTLHALTQRFSMEFALREFLRAFPAETLEQLDRWTTDPHYHVRRLVSESTRPALPWAPRLELAPQTLLPLLEPLHADPTRFVTRSVANHLNDVSKTDASVVLQTLARWRVARRQNPAELEWLCHHALRTLVKQGHAPALKFLGFDAEPPIRLVRYELLTPVVVMDEALVFELELVAERDTALMIDYEIDFQKAGHKRSSKVHKLKQIRLARGESLRARKRHILRSNATTYTLYPGQHHVGLQINGQILGRRSFELVRPT